MISPRIILLYEQIFIKVVQDYTNYVILPNSFSNRPDVT